MSGVRRPRLVGGLLVPKHSCFDRQRALMMTTGTSASVFLLLKSPKAQCTEASGQVATPPRRFTPPTAPHYGRPAMNAALA